MIDNIYTQDTAKSAGSPPHSGSREVAGGGVCEGVK